MEIREDHWLSAIFGHPVFKMDGDVRLFRGGTKDAWVQDLLREHVRHQRAAMYYARVDTGQIDVVRLLSAAGFYIVDVNVTFGMETSARGPQTGTVDGADYPIREIGAEHHEAALAIAGSCFRYSRFHLDPLVPRAIADRIKREWVLSYVRKQRGEKLFIALSNGQPVGFLAALASEEGHRRARIIDLIGVDPAFQGRGIGRALVAFFMDHYRGECDFLQVGTQAANLPSLRLYEKLGFTIAKTQYVMHMHGGPPASGAMTR